MPSQRSPRWLLMLFAAIMILPPFLLFTNLAWLKQQPEGVALTIAGVMAVVVVAASLTLSVIHERRQDEWHRTGSRFSAQWGMAIGTCVVAVLLVAPPLQEAIVSLISGMAGDSAKREYKLVILAFVLGFCTVVLVQGLCTGVVYLIWSRRMSRPAKDPS